MVGYEIIHEAGTYLDRKAIIFYMYNPERRIAKAITLIPPGVPLRDIGGRALETGLFTTKFNKKDIISRLNYKLKKMGVTINDRAKNNFTCVQNF